MLLAWHLDAKFEFHADPDRASELELRFVAAGQHQTRVEFEHRAIERHGQGYEKLRDALDGGWAGILDEFVRVAALPTKRRGPRVASGWRNSRSAGCRRVVGGKKKFHAIASGILQEQLHAAFGQMNRAI